MALPAPIKALVASAQPKRLMMNVIPVAAGAVAAQAGGALLKQVDAVNDFASGGEAQEALVDLAGGLAIDAAILAGVAATQGKAMAEKVAPLLVVGTVVSAAAPLVAGPIADGIEKLVDLVGGSSAPALPPPVVAAPQLAGRAGALKAPAVVNMVRKPGGLYDFPGGLYDMSAFG
jgi:hypothetical protein